MRKSARALGQEFDVNSEVMNQLLKNEGFLEGEPQAYSPTEKAASYVSETDYHRGPGGYACYNRDWTTRTWDESIIDALEITPEKIQAAKDEVTERHQKQREEAKAAQEVAERNFKATGASYLTPDDMESTREEGEDTADKYEKAGTYAGAFLLLGYLGFKEVEKHWPEIKCWWDTKEKPRIKAFFRRT